MYYLDESNIEGYIREKTSLLDGAVMQEVIPLFGDLQSGGDGYINFVYRVVSDKNSFIVKQARSYMQKVGKEYQLPMRRNHLEYTTIELRRAVTPEYVPAIYFIDDSFNLFICEDLSHLKVARYQLSKMIEFPGLGKQMGEFLAKNNFYTSYLYLEPREFRGLQAYYQNDEMRNIMESLIFVPGKHLGAPPPDSQELAAIAETFWEDQRVLEEGYYLRHLYMQKNECLIHSDFHTSNLFVGQGEMKVTDMEYTFMGAFSYDCGYMINNFFAQYCACLIKYEKYGQKALDFAAYILETIRDMFNTYFKVFSECWDADVKEQYRMIPGFREGLYSDFVKEAAGFACCANFSRITGLQGFPDLDHLGDTATVNMGKRLSLAVCKYVLLNRNSFTCVDDIINALCSAAAIALKNL